MIAPNVNFCLQVEYFASYSNTQEYKENDFLNSQYLERGIERK